MHISGLTGTQVWLSSSRSLTNIGSGALAITSTANTVLAASANVDVRPSLGTVGSITIGVTTGGTATANVNIRTYDGTNNIQIAASAASANSATTATMFNTNVCGALINNQDGVNAGRYMYAAFVWTI